MAACKFCGKGRELRFGGCFECADAESIIAEGRDMWDKGMENDEPATSPGQKLKMLIEHGWVKLTETEKEKLMR